MKDVAVTDTIRYVGVDDRTIDLFESQYPVPGGVSYNSYLIRDDKTAVLDTVEGRLRVHLSASGAGDGGGYDRDLGAAKKMIQMVEDALRS